MRKTVRKFSSICLGFILCLSIFGLGAGVLKSGILGTDFVGVENESAVDFGGADLSGSGQNSESNGSNSENQNENHITIGKTDYVRDEISDEEVRESEECTIVQSITLVGGDQASFFAGAEISPADRERLENGGMPVYASASVSSEGKWRGSAWSPTFLELLVLIFFLVSC